MNFLTLVTEVIQGCRVEALGVKTFGPSGHSVSTIWYKDGYIILSTYGVNLPPTGAALVSPLPQDAGMRPRLNQEKI